MNTFRQRRAAIKERLNKATPWKADDKEPASEEWLKNVEANADLCRNAYADLKVMLTIVELQNSILYHIHGLLSDDYFENWEECLEEIESSNDEINSIMKAE